MHNNATSCFKVKIDVSFSTPYSKCTTKKYLITRTTQDTSSEELLSVKKIAQPKQELEVLEPSSHPCLKQGTKLQGYYIC
jgi:hypothetical protein